MQIYSNPETGTKYYAKKTRKQVDTMEVPIPGDSTHTMKKGVFEEYWTVQIDAMIAAEFLRGGIQEGEYDTPEEADKAAKRLSQQPLGTK